MNDELRDMLARIAEATGSMVTHLWIQTCEYVWWSGLSKLILCAGVLLSVLYFFWRLIYNWGNLDGDDVLLGGFLATCLFIVGAVAISKMPVAVGMIASPEGWLVMEMMK